MLKSAWELLVEAHTEEIPPITEILGPFSHNTDEDWMLWRAGRLSEHDYWQRWQDRASGLLPELDNPISDVYLGAEMPVREVVLATASHLTQQGRTVAAVSNGVGRRVGLEWYSRLTAGTPLELLMEAGGLGFRKPSEQFFQGCCDRMQIKFEDLLFVDDNWDYVMAARSLGVTSLWFDVRRRRIAPASDWRPL